MSQQTRLDCSRSIVAPRCCVVDQIRNQRYSREWIKSDLLVSGGFVRSGDLLSVPPKGDVHQRNLSAVSSYGAGKVKESVFSVLILFYYFYLQENADQQLRGGGIGPQTDYSWLIDNIIQPIICFTDIQLSACLPSILIHPVICLTTLLFLLFKKTSIPPPPPTEILVILLSFFIILIIFSGVQIM